MICLRSNAIYYGLFASEDESSGVSFRHKKRLNLSLLLPNFAIFY